MQAASIPFKLIFFWSRGRRRNFTTWRAIRARRLTWRLCPSRLPRCRSYVRCWIAGPRKPATPCPRNRLRTISNWRQASVLRCSEVNLLALLLGRRGSTYLAQFARIESAPIDRENEFDSVTRRRCSSFWLLLYRAPILALRAFFFLRFAFRFGDENVHPC